MTKREAGEVPASTTIWDLPVRVVHWAFVLLLPALWWTWKSGQLPVHRILGYMMLALVLFRFYWGLVGSTTARFRTFVRGPGATLDYVKCLAARREPTFVGHNPLGGWSVVVLLLLLALQVSLGLVSQDVDAMFSGPLSHLVSYGVSDGAREWHGRVFNVLLGFIGLHVFAIACYYFVLRKNLIAPMISGARRVQVAERPLLARAWRALVGIALSATVTTWIAFGSPLP